MIEQPISQVVPTIAVTDHERGAGTLSAAHLQRAERALREDGLVVLENVVDPAHVALLRERMLADVEEILARPDTPFNWIKGNVQQDPPPFAPYLFRDILTNDFVIEITRAVLGDGLVNTMYSGNTSLPGGERQPVHADMGQLWPHLETSPPPYALVVNVPLVDVDARNGSTEIWPGTHQDTSVVIGKDITVTSEMADKRRMAAPPFQPAIRSGSVVIRDIRLWHAGMPNFTDVPRPMIAMIHWVNWWPHGKAVPFAPEAGEILAHPILQTNAEFVDGTIDYLHHNAAYGYTK